MREEDLTGKRFGMLVVEYPEPRVDGKKQKWVCKCDCGREVSRARYYLVEDRIKGEKSCGCQRFKKGGPNKKKRLYSIWCGMKERCYRQGHPAYHRYGGRGITVCEDWLHNYEVFEQWSSENGYSEGLTIDRIDNDEGYYPGNCRWVDMKTQCNNTARNHYITWNGATHTMAEWSRLLGISYGTLKDRIYRQGKSDIEALRMGACGR